MGVWNVLVRCRIYRRIKLNIFLLILFIYLKKYILSRRGDFNDNFNRMGKVIIYFMFSPDLKRGFIFINSTFILSISNVPYFIANTRQFLDILFILLFLPPNGPKVIVQEVSSQFERPHFKFNSWQKVTFFLGKRQYI